MSSALSSPPKPRKPTRRDDVIQIRASAETKTLISRAAAMRGQNLSEFMLETARERAETALLDQRAFFLSPDAFDAFVACLDAPAGPPAALVELMARKAPWSR